MGYFANGTEGELYRERYCYQCAHYSDYSDDECPVWDAHLMSNYNQNGNDDLVFVLENLIPRAGAGNGQCAMFIPRTATGLTSAAPAPQE